MAGSEGSPVGATDGKADGDIVGPGVGLSGSKVSDKEGHSVGDEGSRLGGADGS